MFNKTVERLIVAAASSVSDELLPEHRRHYNIDEHPEHGMLLATALKRRPYSFERSAFEGFVAGDDSMAR